MRITPFRSLEGSSPWEFQLAGQDTRSPLGEHDAADDSDTYLPDMGQVPQKDNNVWDTHPDPRLLVGEPMQPPPRLSRPSLEEDTTTQATGFIPQAYRHASGARLSPRS